MEDQFAELSDAYEDSADLPLRRHLETHTLLSVLGDLRGLSVLDAGCGTGVHTRRFRRLGAARVVGLDISAGMLAAARIMEQREPLGIEYVAGDLADAAGLGTFDLVVAVHVLPYAESAGRLAAMCRGAAGALGRGGRFVTMVLNPGLSDDPDFYAPYGFRMSSPHPRADGDPAILTLAGSAPDPVIVTARYWSRQAHETAFRAAGFDSVTWTWPQVSARGLTEYGAEFWQRYLQYPHVLTVDCRPA